MEEGVRAAGVTGVTVTASGRASEPTLSIGTHLAIDWAEIAIANAQVARRARQALADVQRRGSPLEVALATEMHASLIAISAAANALDALFAELRPLVFTADFTNRWKKNGTKRRQQIRETFKHGFRIVGDHWGSDFDWLFDLRADAVRPGASAHDPGAGPHPLGIDAAPEFCRFTCEGAERAARLIVDVCCTCAAYPWPATEEWAQEMGPMVEKLRADLESALAAAQ
jgi:hypothetical protein